MCTLKENIVFFLLWVGKDWGDFETQCWLQYAYKIDMIV